MENKNNADWLQKYKETITILIIAFSGFLWLNNKFDHINERFSQVNERFSQVDKEMALMKKDIDLIKAFMIMKNIMPPELVKEEEK